MLTFVFVLILLFAGTTVVSHIAVTFGIFSVHRKKKKTIHPGKEDNLLISVVIPARDEEANLPRLFASLEGQTNGKFEVVFINDRSADGTGRLLREFKEKHGDMVTIVTLTEHPEEIKLNPKQYALLQGINAAKGDILLFTDADCSVPADWISFMSAPFADPKVGLCLGPIETSGDGTFLYRFQYFDHIFRYCYTLGSAGMNMPTGGFGNNLAVRRQALSGIGGYESIGYSVTEDAALVVALREKTDFSITAVPLRKSTVTALPQETWRALSKQERRWSYGAFQSPDPKTVFGYASVMVFLFAGLAAVPLSFIISHFFVIIISTFSSMLMVAIAGGISLQCSFRKYWLLLLPCIFFSSFFYTFNNILSFFNIPITWKGKDLDKM